MIDTEIIKRNILEDLTQDLIPKYIIFNTLIYEDIPIDVLNYIFYLLVNDYDELMILQKDIICLRYQEILIFKSIAVMLNENLSLIEYGLSALFDKQTDIVLLKGCDKITGTDSKINLDKEDDVLLDEEFSKNLKNYLVAKFSEYSVKYNSILDGTKKMMIDNLKTDVKYLYNI